MYYDAVFHFDKGEEELKIAISNLNNYFEGLGDTFFAVSLVVNGPGIKLMGRDGEYAKDLESLCDRGLDLKVCNNAMNKFGITSDWLIESCKIVPAGLLEIVHLQRKGFAYIKP